MHMIDRKALKNDLLQVCKLNLKSAGVMIIDIPFKEEEMIKILNHYLPMSWIYRIRENMVLSITSNTEEVRFKKDQEEIKKLLRKEYGIEVIIYGTYQDEDPDIEMMIKQIAKMARITREYINENEEKNEYKDNLINNQYQIVLQPKIEIKNNKICGCEALLRYHLKDGIILPPASIISKLESDGSIREVDMFVYETVCNMIAEWKKRGLQEIPVSFNFSRVTLLDQNLVYRMQEISRWYKVDERLLEVEITESIGDIDMYIIKKAVNDIMSAGYPLILDDFGSEYSNVAILSEVAFKCLKIDKSFIHAISSNRKLQYIIRCLIDMCHGLNIETVAEGVENEAQLQLLKEMGADIIQGYIISKPISREEFENTYMKYDFKGKK